MTKIYEDYINDIISSIKDIADFIAGMTFEAFIKDKKTINAVIRSLEVIGEAANNIPDEIKDNFSDIPWNKMVSMRNKLIHEYFGVDLEIVWIVINDEIPPLKPLIQKVLENQKLL